MLTQIWGTTDIIFYNFRSFVIFYTFNPLLTTKSKIWKKCKKTAGDIIILHMCTINQDHIMYGSWDKKHKDRVFCHFGTFFYPLTLLTTQKIKILKKKSLGILSVYTCVPQMMIIQCIIPEISSVTDRIICHFGLFFALLPL